MVLEEALKLSEVESQLDTKRVSLPAAFRPYLVKEGTPLTECEKAIVAVRDISKEGDADSQVTKKGFTYFIADMKTKKIIERPTEDYIKTLEGKDDWVVS